MEDRRIHEVINYFVFVSLFLKTNRFHVSVRQFNNKQLLDEVEHDIKQLLRDIRNNQGRGKCYQPKPKAEADNTYRDLKLIDFSGYHKNRI